jgi:hypothetical protein
MKPDVPRSCFSLESKTIIFSFEEGSGPAKEKGSLDRLNSKPGWTGLFLALHEALVVTVCLCSRDRDDG